MKVLATALILLTGPATAVVHGRSEAELLRDRCNEQERQIRALESEIESLHSQLALERRLARGATVASPAKPAKQVVRDIQSLAMARFGVGIDRRTVSVVQLGEEKKGGEADAPSEEVEQAFYGD